MLLHHEGGRRIVGLKIHLHIQRFFLAQEDTSIQHDGSKETFFFFFWIITERNAIPVEDVCVFYVSGLIIFSTKY